MTIERFEDYKEELREKYGEPKSSVFTVSGLAGVGTTTIAKILETEYNLNRHNAGDFFRKEARKREVDIYDFMENLDKIAKGEKGDLDIECDKFLLELPFKENNVLVESRLAGILLKDIANIRIWVKCPPKIAADRLSKRENKSYNIALNDIRKRNKNDQKRFKKKYGIDATNDKYYNIFIDNSKDLEDVRKSLLRKVNKKLRL